MPVSESQVVLLTGGLGGARLAPSLRDALGPGRLTVVANVGDDLDWHGVRVCPDLDSVTYSLVGLWDHERGWGLRDETFRVRDALGDFQEPPWFNVGDRDLALHLLRGDYLRSGRSLTDATREPSRRLVIGDVPVLPASEEPNETRVLPRNGRLLHFQEWCFSSWIARTPGTKSRPAGQGRSRFWRTSLMQHRWPGRLQGSPADSGVSVAASSTQFPIRL